MGNLSRYFVSNGSLFITYTKSVFIRIQKGSPLEGTSLREGVLRSRSGASILVIKRGEEVVPNPDPVWELQEKDIVLLLGTPEQLAAAGRLFEPDSSDSAVRN